MRKGWIGEALGKRGPSASYTNYQAQKSQADRGQGAVLNALPAGKRIGPKSKTRGYKAPKDTDRGENYTVDARIGSGPKVDFDRKNKRTPISMASPTSPRKSSGKAGPSKYVG